MFEHVGKTRHPSIHPVPFVPVPDVYKTSSKEPRKKEGPKWKMT